ncbi:MAG: amidohydrolase family protein [Gammaproteobacteria bacterium]|nr:amidohydrolase family protein [Gammaproteobacteria bacterium]
MAFDRDAWRAQVIEEAIEPEFSICDAHHHLIRSRNNSYMLDDLIGDTATGHHVASTVFVECGTSYRASGPDELRPVGETEFVDELAATAEAAGGTRVAAAIVAYADLRLGKAVRPVLEAHLAASGRFRGIRQSGAWDGSGEIPTHSIAPPGLYRDAAFREGFACLVDLDLCFDAWLFHPQLGDLADLAMAFPGARIVLNHAGGLLGVGPYERQAEEAGWRRGIGRLAECPNVHIKLGGMTMPVYSGFGWHRRPGPPDSAQLAEETGPYYRHCIERFGAERCMFESNFPVDKTSCSYAVLWNSFKLLSRDYSLRERQQLLCGTAERFYRIGH